MKEWNCFKKVKISEKNDGLIYVLNFNEKNENFIDASYTRCVNIMSFFFIINNNKMWMCKLNTDVLTSLYVINNLPEFEAKAAEVQCVSLK